MMLAVMWAMTAAMLGFMAGRVSMYGLAEVTEGEEVKEEQAFPEERKAGHRRGRGRRDEEEGRSWSVGSPVSGWATIQREGEHPSIVFHPDTGKIHAPADGRITRLFPMGNAFLFTTEFGTELYIQVGDRNDELLSRYYRPRILQNEVVGKGKLILEFDREGLEAEGASSDVTVSLENSFYGGDIRLTAPECVESGEEIIRIQEPVGLRACQNYYLCR